VTCKRLKKKRKYVESSLNCFSFNFFSCRHSHWCQYYIWHRVMLCLSFSRSLILLFSLVFLPLSTSFFCQLKLVIKSREQSSVILESDNAHVRTYSTRLLLLFLDFIDFFLSLVLFFISHIHTASALSLPGKRISIFLARIPDYFMSTHHSWVGNDDEDYSMRFENKRKKKLKFFFFFFSPFIIASLSLPSYWNHSRNIHLFLVIIVFLCSFIHIFSSLFSLNVCVYLYFLLHLFF
jgi:hypothetical protein